VVGHSRQAIANVLNECSVQFLLIFVAGYLPRRSPEWTRRAIELLEAGPDRRVDVGKTLTYVEASRARTAVARHAALRRGPLLGLGHR
jgi:hypothetical protein